MGLLNKLWSGADFWDKKENKQQRDDFAKQDEERKKREAEARAQAQAKQQAQRDTQKQRPPATVSPLSTPIKPMAFGPQAPTPDIIQQLYKPLQQPAPNPPQAPQPVKLNKFGNPEPERGMENGKAGTYFTGKTSGQRTFIPDAVPEDHSLWGKVKRNADMVRKVAGGTVASVGEVGLAAGRTATGLVQGAGQIPHMVSALAATGTEKLKNNFNNSVTRQLNRGFQDVNTGVKKATHYAIDDTFDPLNRNLDHAAQMYGRTIGDEQTGVKNYKNTQVGLNVLAALLTMGASTASKAGQAGEVADAAKLSKLAKVSAFLNKPIAGSADDIISKVGGGALDKFAGTANALNTPFGSTKNKLTELFGGSGTTSEVADTAATTAKAANTAVPTVPKPNEVAPGVKSTNVKPEIIKPEPVALPPEPVKPPTPVKSTDERLAGLKGQRESLAQERDALLTDGGDVKDVEKRIKSVDRAIAEHTTPPKTAEAKSLADGDKQLAEATTPKTVKPEMSKQELPSKPKASEKGVTTRQMTVDEMHANNMSEEAIANVMAKRAETVATTAKAANTAKGAVKKTEAAPVKIAPADGSVTWENPSTKKLETFPDQATLDAHRAKRSAEGQKKIAEKFKTQAQKDQLEIDRANAVRKAEGSEPLPSKPVKEPKTVAPEPVKAELPSKPDKAALQKGAAENTTASGKVSQKWINQQVKDGANADDLKQAIEKVNGPEVPKKVPKEMAGGIASADTQGVSVSGDVIDRTSKKAAENLGKSEASKTTATKFVDDMAAQEKAGKAFSQKDAETAVNLQKKVEFGSKEWHDLGDINRKSGTQAAQTLATRRKQVRDTGTAEDIVSNYINRVRDNTGVRLTSDDLTEINRKVATEVKLRTEFNKTQEAYLADTSDPAKQAAAVAAHEARNAARKEAMIEEMRTTVGIKGGDNKAKKDLTKLIDKLNKDAEVWQMDYVDTGLLSTTGTWVANIVNSIGGGIEEALFGKLGAKFANFRTGTTTIGGGNSFGIKAQKFGFKKLVAEANDRRGLPSKNIVDKGMNYLKNFVTTMNEIGNTQIDAPAHAAVSAEYRNLLKAEYPTKFGGKLTKEAKKELDNLVEYHALVDPRDLKQKYIDYGFKVQGMAAVLGKAGKTRAAKLENRMASGISNFLRQGDSNPIPKGLADGIGKLTMRVTIGFPTIVARSAGQGLRRVSGGAPTFLQAAWTKDPVEKAMLIKQGVKELGSGVAMVSAGVAAGNNGMITGSYPTDKTTQDEWAKEGKSEWSIKVKNPTNGKSSWVGLPRMLGPFAIPFLIGAQMGDNNASGDGVFQADAIKQMANSVAKSYDATMPAGQISDNIDTITNLAGLFSGDENEQKKANAALSKFAGNALRIGAVPLSGMLNQITQSTTGTQKDTKGDGGILEPIISYVMSGLPGLNQRLADKTSADGTVLTTTDPLARAFGAQSTENAAGVADNKKQVEDNQNDLSPIINDKNVYDLLEPETQKLLNQTQDPKSKKRLNDQNLETIYKDVSKTTEKLASNGKWGSYGNTLKIKLNTQKADKKSTPEEQAVTQRQVKQADILDKHGIDAKVFALYDLSAEKGGISASDFKKMIDPEETDYYDMETANALWKLDKLFTEAGVSGNNTGAIDPWTKQKYSMPKDKNGSGGKDKGIGTNFGTIGTFAKPPAGNLSQKYQKLTNPGSPLANLTTSSSQTNLKKNISVVKGVRL